MGAAISIARQSSVLRQAERKLRMAGMFALLSAALLVLSFMSLIVFFVLGEPFGAISDAASASFALSLLPVAVGLHALHGPVMRRPSLATSLVGIVGMVIAGGVQISLVLGFSRFEETLGTVLTGFGLIGAWFLLEGVLGRATRAVPAALAWPGLTAGIGYAATILGFWLGREGHPLFLFGSLVAFAGALGWTIWTGRFLLTTRASSPARREEVMA